MRTCGARIPCAQRRGREGRRFGANRILAAKANENHRQQPLKSGPPCGVRGDINPPGESPGRGSGGRNRHGSVHSRRALPPIRRCPVPTHTSPSAGGPCPRVASRARIASPRFRVLAAEVRRLIPALPRGRSEFLGDSVRRVWFTGSDARDPMTIVRTQPEAVGALAACRNATEGLRWLVEPADRRPSLHPGGRTDTRLVPG